MPGMVAKILKAHSRIPPSFDWLAWNKELRSSIHTSPVTDWVSFCQCEFEGDIHTIVEILPCDLGDGISDFIPDRIYLLSRQSFQQFGANSASSLAAQG
jgi:hypothetical protein